MAHSNPGTTIGTAQTLPNGTNVEDYMNQQLAADPNFQPPAGFHVENGQVVHDEQGFLMSHPWLFPLMGIGAGAGLAAAGVGAGAAGAGAGGVGPLAGGYGAATTTAAAPAGIAAGGGGMSLSGLLGSKPIIDAVGAGVSKLAGNMANDRGTSASLSLDAQRQFENELMARQQNQRTAQSNALKQSIFASMLQGYQPSARPAGIPASPFANGLGATGNQATSFIAQDALSRLKAGDQLPPLQPLNVSQYSSPSIWETLLGLGGAAASGYGGAFGKK